MGGCCSSSSSRHSHLVGAPLYYYCPESFEELGHSGARGGVGSAALTTTGLLADIIGLDTSSIPDTFNAPAPLPYDLLFGRPDSESIKEKISDSSFETCEDLGGLVCNTQPSSVILSPSESDFSKQKTWNNQLVDEEEEDSCPICFEDYEAENPKIKTNCEHDFHLSLVFWSGWKEAMVALSVIRQLQERTIFDENSCRIIGQIVKRSSCGGELTQCLSSIQAMK